MREQDDHLEEISQIALRLNEHAKDINVEVGNQQGMIGQLGQSIDKTQGRLDFVNKKLQILLKTNDRSQICTVLILFGVLVMLVFLLIYT